MLTISAYISTFPRRPLHVEVSSRKGNEMGNVKGKFSAISGRASATMNGEGSSYNVIFLYEKPARQWCTGVEKNALALRSSCCTGVDSEECSKFIFLMHHYHCSGEQQQKCPRVEWGNFPFTILRHEKENSKARAVRQVEEKLKSWNYSDSQPQ